MKKGDWVVPSEKGMKTIGLPRDAVGVVVGISKDRKCAYVTWDHQSEHTKARYHMSFLVKTKANV